MAQLNPDIGISDKTRGQELHRFYLRHYQVFASE